MSAGTQRELRRCECSACQEQPGSDLARQHRDINRLLATLDEKARRLFVAFLAR